MKILFYFLKSVLGISFFFVFMFIAAGTLHYTEGWVYFAVSMFGLVMTIATTRDDALLSERSRPGSPMQTWDKKILTALLLVTIVAYTIAGLDSGRYHWTTPCGTPVMLLGVLLVISGQIIFTIAKYQNHFFSSVARIQNDRDHTVCDKGLYKIVRHPGYCGMIISWIGFPVIMSSLYSIVPVTMAIVLLMVRTHLEDMFLARALDGYSRYAQHTTYRLLPFIW